MKGKKQRHHKRYTRHHAPRPAVSWTLPHTADEGQPIAFSWAGRHLGRKHRLVIQKPEGTAHTWRTIMPLHGNSGSAELPGLALGKYRFRLADLAGRRVLARQASGVGVFGQVPFSTLFGNRDDSGVASTPQNSFPYVAAWDGEYEDNPIFKVEHNHCNYVHIGFLVTFLGPGTTGSLTVVQESRDPVTVTAGRDTIGSLDAALVPGQSWAVNGETVSEHINLNGYAICDSTDSFFS
ncbi:MAG: hypothetical protein WAW96_14480 [Alphaproteobacteria bacterium]